jgi:hypothetical protein
MDVGIWLEGYRRAWESADVDALADLFAETASYHSHLFREPAVGRPAIED